MRVLTSISDSPCVVQLRNDWEAYIEDRGYVPNHGPNHTTLEYVRAGQVRLRKCVTKKRAPAIIVQWMRRWNAGVMP